jgi:cell division protein FtsB
MSKLMAFFSRQKQAVDQQQEIKKLKAEIEKLRLQNESMRAGMRRCTTCDYRIDYKNRQGKT